MKHTDHVRETIRKDYFTRFSALKIGNPDKSNRELWLMLEATLDHDMYSSYGSFRCAYHHYQKSIKKKR